MSTYTDEKIDELYQAATEFADELAAIRADAVDRRIVSAQTCDHTMANGMGYSSTVAALAVERAAVRRINRDEALAILKAADRFANTRAGALVES